MFGFRVTYLRGSVTASDVGTGQSKISVEWPPHPDRLFCALVRSWADMGMPGDVEEALRWLERCPPPEIRCGRYLPHTNPVRYVPVNDDFARIGPSIQGTPLFRVRQPRRIPSAPLSDERVIFWWADVSPEARVGEALARAASLVANLGHSSSFVMVEFIGGVDGIDDLERTYVPQPSGRLMIRIPYEGRFDELREAYEGGRRPPQSSRWVSYGEYEAGEESSPARGSHGELVVFRLRGEGRRLSILHTGYVTALWRRALMKSAPQPPPPVISGHSPESTPENPVPLSGPHLALLPLPDVGHRYARSHLMGLAAALPADIGDDERYLCLKTLVGVQNLRFRGWGDHHLEPCGAEERARALRPETWTRKSRIWASVTPVVFGRYPKEPWGEEAEAILKESCKIAGLPEPFKVDIAPISWVLGVPPSFDFPPLPHTHAGNRRFHVHARLVFDVDVEGPVLVGVGRHLGYGFFMPVIEKGEDEYEA
jgi:CRISPR-associated protein Csb2